MRKKWIADSCISLMIILSTGLAYAQDIESNGAKELTSTDKVVDNNGRPIPEAKVVLYYNYSKWDLGNRIIEETTSNSHGSFVFERPLTYSSTSGYPYGRDSYVILGACRRTRG